MKKNHFKRELLVSLHSHFIKESLPVAHTGHATKTNHHPVCPVADLLTAIILAGITGSHSLRPRLIKTERYKTEHICFIDTGENENMEAFYSIDPLVFLTGSKLE